MFVIFLAFVLPSGECAWKTAELKIVNFVLLLSVCRTDPTLCKIKIIQHFEV